MTRGVPTSGGGTVRLVVYDPAAPASGRTRGWRSSTGCFPTGARRSPDSGLRADVQEANPAPVILVTKDLNMNLKAKAVGITCQDYLNDKVDARDVNSYELRRIEVESDGIAALWPVRASWNVEASRLRGRVCQPVRPAVRQRRNTPCRRASTATANSRACNCRTACASRTACT